MIRFSEIEISRKMFDTFDDAISHFKNIPHVKELKMRVVSYLLENTQKKFDENHTFQEKFKLYNDNNNWYEFCGSIMVHDTTHRLLNQFEKRAIERLLEEDRKVKEENKSDEKYTTMFHCIGERIEYSDKYFLLSTFIGSDKKEEADRFLDDYKKHNSLVNTYIVESSVDVPIVNLIHKDESTIITKPSYVSYRSILFHCFYKTDEQIEMLERSFDSDIKRYYDMKEVGMEEDAGIIYSVIEKAKKIYSDDDDKSLISKLRETLVSESSRKKRPRVSDADADTREYPVVIPINKNVPLSEKDIHARLEKLYSNNDTTEDELDRLMCKVSDVHDSYPLVVKRLIAYNILLHNRHFNNYGAIEVQRGNKPTSPLLIGFTSEDIIDMSDAKTKHDGPFGYMINDLKNNVPICPFGYTTTVAGLIRPRLRP